MSKSPLTRVLVVESTAALRADYAALLGPPQNDAAETAADDGGFSGLFGCLAPPPGFPPVDPVLAADAAAALAAVKEGQAAHKPFAVAFVELRQAALEGDLRLLESLRAADPELLLVAVAAEPEPHPMAVAQRVPPVEQVFYLLKPFHPFEVQSLVLALSARWHGARKRGATAEDTRRQRGPAGAPAGFDALPCGLIVFDRRDRLVSANGKLRALLPEIEELLVPGLPYESLQLEIARRLLPDDTLFLEDAWLKERLEWHAKSGGVIDQRLSGGRWVVLAESGGPLGETYCLYLDVTGLKRRDQNRAANQRLRQVAEALQSFCAALAKAADDEGRLAVKDLGRQLFDGGLDEGGRNGAQPPLADLARKLRIVTQATPLLATPLRLDGLIADILRDKREALPEAVDIEVANGAGLWDVDADIGLIRATLAELIDNAVAACGPEGRIFIETGNQRLDRDFVASRPALSQGDYVHLTIRDEGGGMTADEAERAFTPFYRGARAAGEGLGLGLSMALGAAGQSGGHLEIESQAGSGTALHLYLPRAKLGRAAAKEAPPPDAAEDQRPPAAGDGGRTEDDEGMIW